MPAKVADFLSRTLLLPGSFHSWPISHIHLRLAGYRDSRQQERVPGAILDYRSRIIMRATC